MFVCVCVWGVIFPIPPVSLLHFVPLFFLCDFTLLHSSSASRSHFLFFSCFRYYLASFYALPHLSFFFSLQLLITTCINNTNAHASSENKREPYHISFPLSVPSSSICRSSSSFLLFPSAGICTTTTSTKVTTGSMPSHGL